MLVLFTYSRMSVRSSNTWDLVTTTTWSPSWMVVRPPGMMILFYRAMAASSTPFFRVRSFRGLSSTDRLEAVAVNSNASTEPSSIL